MMSKIIDAMGLVSALNKSHGVKQRGGKMYTQVVHRMEAFRTVFGLDYGVDTTIIVDDGKKVVIKAVITNENGIVVGSGMAEEIRGDGHVNTTSALENCESSAVGRALASVGLAGGEYASANEMDAVPRKAENLKHQTGGSDVSSPPLSPAPPSDPAPTPVSEPSDPDKEADTNLYMQLEAKIAKKTARAAVDQVYIEHMDKLKALQARNPERHEKFIALFKNRLNEIEGV
jgi:hypothetical protein